MPQLSFASPAGPITVSEDEGRIVALDWGWARDNEETPLLRETRNQLDAYFDRRLFSFDLPLDPFGTEFQRRVWRHMLSISYGGTLSYGQVAQALGSGPRAVGMACGRNPIPILVPCHRVLAAGGRLGGYSGHEGVETKMLLLRLEGSWPQATPESRRSAARHPET